MTADYTRDVQELWKPSIRSDESSVRLPPLMPNLGEMMMLSTLAPNGETQQPLNRSPRSARQTKNEKKLPPHRAPRIEQNQHTLQTREDKQEQPQEEGSPQDDDSGSDVSDDEDDPFAHIDMEALKSRGKGSHTCPKGKNCTKGGIDKNGELIVFDRNSAFL
jgi:hypothetical protein